MANAQFSFSEKNFFSDFFRKGRKKGRKSCESVCLSSFFPGNLWVSTLGRHENRARPHTIRFVISFYPGGFGFKWGRILVGAPTTKLYNADFGCPEKS